MRAGAASSLEAKAALLHPPKKIFCEALDGAAALVMLGRVDKNLSALHGGKRAILRRKPVGLTAAALLRARALLLDQSGQLGVVRLVAYRRGTVEGAFLGRQILPP